MSEDACHKAGLHLVLCCRALDDKDRMKTSFSLLLSVPMELEDEEKYNLEQVIYIHYLMTVWIKREYDNNIMKVNLA